MILAFFLTFRLPMQAKSTTDKETPRSANQKHNSNLDRKVTKSTGDQISSKNKRKLDLDAGLSNSSPHVQAKFIHDNKKKLLKQNHVINPDDTVSMGNRKPKRS